MSTTCLNTLVGLSDRDNTCFDTDRPGTAGESTSGYYLTDREFGFPLKEAVLANLDGSYDTIWDEMSEARSKAITSVKNDIKAGLSKVRQKRVLPWTGRLGTIQTEEDSVYNTTTKDVVGIQLRPRKMRYVSFVVRAIWLYQDTTGSVDVNITSNDSSFIGQTETISAVAGTPVRHQLSSELELSFYSLYIDELRYNFSYSTGLANPLWNKVVDPDCGFESWMQHMRAYGFELDNMDDNHDAASNDAFGLALEGYIKPDPLGWICNLNEKGGEEYLDMIARLIQLRGAINLMAIILESGNINRYTILESKRLLGKISNYRKTYSEIFMQLINEIPPRITEVFGAKKEEPQINSIIT